MLKYALVNNNKVENIIVVDSKEFIEHIKPQYQYIECIEDQDVHIGFLWNGKKFFEDPESVEKRKRDLEEFNKQTEQGS